MPASQSPSPCPPIAELDAFNLGAVVPSARFAQLAAHLETCLECVQKLEARATLAMPWDATQRLEGAEQQGQRSPTFCREPQFRDALQRIARIPAQSLAADSPPRIGVYEIQERLGAGGMGTVYKSWHPRLQRPVVLKMIRGRAAEESQAIAQFRDEMATVGQIDHPLIVKAYDAQAWEGREYLVMEYVGGLNLRQLVQRDGVFSVEDACAVIHEAALGLAHLHDRGILHRDLKPSNIALADDGRVKILDLGLALTTEAASDAATEAATAAAITPREGTLDFMSPEQFVHSRRVAAATDLFSLGATLYYLLVGESPWAGVDRRTDSHTAVAAAPRFDSAKLPPRLPRAVRACLVALLAVRPEDRPASALKAAAALRPYAKRSQRIELTPLPVPLTPSRVPWIAGLATLFVVVALATTLALRAIDADHKVAGRVDVGRVDVGRVDSGQSEASIESPSSASASERRPFVAWRPGSSANQLEGLAQLPPLFEDLARWQVETIRPRGVVQGMAVSHDGRHFALVSQDGAVRVFAVDDQRQSSRLISLLPADAPPRDAPRQLA